MVFFMISFSSASIIIIIIIVFYTDANKHNVFKKLDTAIKSEVVNYYLKKIFSYTVILILKS